MASAGTKGPRRQATTGDGYQRGTRHDHLVRPQRPAEEGVALQIGALAYRVMRLPGLGLADWA